MGGVKDSEGDGPHAPGPFRAFIPPQVPLAEIRGTCGGIAERAVRPVLSARQVLVQHAAGFRAQAAAQAA